MIVAMSRMLHRVMICGSLVAMLNCTNAALSQDKIYATLKTSGQVATVKSQANAGPIQATPILNVVPQTGATGEELARQLKVAGQVREAAQRSNYLPEARIRHFAWLDNTNAPPVTGWTGVIEDLTETPQGTRVRLHITPKFAGLCYTSVFTTETFLVKNGSVRAISLVTSDPAGPRVVTIP